MKGSKLLCALLTSLILCNSNYTFAENPQSIIRQVKEETKKVRNSNKKISRLITKLTGNNYNRALGVLKSLGDSDADGLPDLLDKKRCEASPLIPPANPQNPAKPVDSVLSGSYAGTFKLIEDNCGLSDYFINDGYYTLNVITNSNNQSASVYGFTSACEEKFNGIVNSNIITASYNSDFTCPLGSSTEVKHSLELNGISNSGFSYGTLTRKVSCSGFGTCQLKYSGQAIKISSTSMCK